MKPNTQWVVVLRYFATTYVSFDASQFSMTKGRGQDTSSGASEVEHEAETTAADASAALAFFPSMAAQCRGCRPYPQIVDRQCTVNTTIDSVLRLPARTLRGHGLHEIAFQLGHLQRLGSSASQRQHQHAVRPVVEQPESPCDIPTKFFSRPETPIERASKCHIYQFTRSSARAQQSRTEN